MFKLNRKSKVYNNGKYSNIQQTGYMYIHRYIDTLYDTTMIQYTYTYICLRTDSSGI